MDRYVPQYPPRGRHRAQNLQSEDEDVSLYGRRYHPPHLESRHDMHLRSRSPRRGGDMNSPYGVGRVPPQDRENTRLRRLNRPEMPYERRASPPFSHRDHRIIADRHNPDHGSSKVRNHREEKESATRKKADPRSRPKNFPQPLTCFYWSTGKCSKSAEECWYAHWNTGIVAGAPVSINNESVAGRNADARIRTYDQYQKERERRHRVEAMDEALLEARRYEEHLMDREHEIAFRDAHSRDVHERLRDDEDRVSHLEVVARRQADVLEEKKRQIRTKEFHLGQREAQIKDRLSGLRKREQEVDQRLERLKQDQGRLDRIAVKKQEAAKDALKQKDELLDTLGALKQSLTSSQGTHGSQSDGVNPRINTELDDIVQLLGLQITDFLRPNPVNENPQE